MKKNYLLIVTCIFLFTGFQAKAQGSFSLATPANGAYASAKPYFDWANSTGATYYQLFIDGVLKKNNISTSYYQLITGEEITQGMHTWYVNAVGTGTIQSNETWSILVDATQPSSFNLISPADNSWTSSLQPTLTWSASSDVSSGLAKYQLWIDGNLNRDNISASATSTTPTNALTNDSHTWEIRVVDNVGNVMNSIQNWTVKVDNIPPRNGLSTCLYFDGINDYCTVPHNSSLNFTGAITIEAWIKITSYYNWSAIVSKGNFNSSEYGYAFTGDYQGHIVFYGDGPAYSSNGIIPLNTWTHVAVVYGSNILKFYINGEFDKSLNKSITIVNNTVPLRIGIDPPETAEYFRGNIDEIRIWNYVRSQSEISANTNNVMDECTSGLVGYWRFNEAAGNTIFDQSAFHNNGTISGAVYNNSPFIVSVCNLKTPVINQYMPTSMPSFYWGKTLDDGVGFEKFQLFVDCNLLKDNLSDSSWTITTPLPYGKHTWFVKGFDFLGNNQSSDSYTFYIDNVKPNAFNLISTINSQIVSLPTPNLTWQATIDSTGGSGLSKYQLWINGVKNRDSIPISQTTVAPSSALAQGAYTWFIKAYDKTANLRQSTQTWTFYVDWEPPTAFTLIDPVDNATLTVSRPLFKWNSSSDIGSGLDRYELCISGQAPITILPTDTIKLLTFDLPNGPYTWFVKAYDKAGAFTSSNTHSLTINVPLPGLPATPTGANESCVNSANTDFTTTGATNADSYIWEITPVGAGTFSGTGLTGTVDWNNTFTGTAQIKVKGHNNAGDGIFSAPITVTVYPATIAGSVSGSSNICLGASTGSLTLSGYAGNIIKWQKRVNGGSWSDIAYTATTYSETPATIGTWEYRAGIQSGVCSSLFSTVATIIVGNIPATAGTISGTATVCQSQNSITYTVPIIANATSYLWTLPSGATGTSTTNSITVNFGISVVSGNITVKGNNSCGDGATSTLAITVNPLPASAGTISGTTTICQGQNSVTYTVPAIANAISYLWTLPSGATGTSTTNSITVNYGILAVSGNITVKGNNSCGDGATSTLAITVNPLPASAGIISGTTTVCLGQNSVTYTVPTIANATSYLWTLPSGASGTSTTNSITVNYGASAVSDNLIVKGNNSCGDGVTSTLAITVNPLPASAGIITGTTTICQGQNSVTYTVPAITNATSYIWTLPSGATGTSTTNSITVNYGASAVSGNITVKGNNSCGDGATSTLAITVNPLPASAGTITGTTTVCQEQNSVNYTVPAITNAIAYIWTLPSGVTGTSATNSITVNYGTSAVSGNIIVKGTNDCGDGGISTLAITVNAIPTTPVISLNGYVLHSDAPNGNQWYNQSGLISDALFQDYTATENGDYYVIVTINGCSSEPSNTIQFTNVGIELIENNRSIKVYPNPVSSELIIEIEGNNEKVNFEILNSIGHVAFRGNLLERTVVQTSGFAPGIYLIKFENGKSFEFKKIIKE